MLTAKNKNNTETKKKSKKNPVLILFAHLDLVSVKIIPHSYLSPIAFWSLYYGLLDGVVIVSGEVLGL